jgi:cytidine deaminase
MTQTHMLRLPVHVSAVMVSMLHLPLRLINAPEGYTLDPKTTPCGVCRTALFAGAV